MATGYKARGGGANSLNFKVIGGTSAPANPKENTIWVNTDQKITEWHFGADEPSAIDGMVWIKTGNSSPVAFNALKKNSIQVCPMSAQQYIGVAWVDKTAKSYQGGAWVDNYYYIFKSGSGLNSAFTGFTNATHTLNEVSASGAGLGEFESGKHRTITLNEQFDATNYSTFFLEGINAKVYSYGNQGYCYITLYVGDAFVRIYESGFISEGSEGSWNVANNKTVSLDVSGLSGKVTIKVETSFSSTYGMRLDSLSFKDMYAK